MRLGNKHPVQDKLARKTQVLIRKFPICINNIIQGQLGLLLFLKILKYPYIYREDFVSYQNQESNGQNRDIWQSAL